MFRGEFTSNTKLTDCRNNFTGDIGAKGRRLTEGLMVSSGKRIAAGGREPAAVDMERLKPLHNFDFPWLKWGNQKLLRCMKVDSNGDVSVIERNQSSESGAGGGGVIGTKRRNSELEKRFRSSDGDERKMESYYKFSSPEKVKERIGISRDGEKRFRSSDDGDRNTGSCHKFSPPEKVKARIGIAGDGEIEATREKLMFDFQMEVGKMKEAILGERLVDPPPATATYNPPADRPWNLRTRRAACKAPRSPTNGVNCNGEVLRPNFSPARNECKFPKLRPMSSVSGATTSGEKTQRPKFSVSISRCELEEDFMAMAGRRLPRKPKKRSRNIQKQLDTLFPGLWLSEITADLYKVPDEAEIGKR
ncbi:hypothetical protein R6Q59_012188 [Mikania micrantha]